MICVFGSQGKLRQVPYTAAAESFFRFSGLSNDFTELKIAGTKFTGSKTIKQSWRISFHP